MSEPIHAVWLSVLMLHAASAQTPPAAAGQTSVNIAEVEAEAARTRLNLAEEDLGLNPSSWTVERTNAAVRDVDLVAKMGNQHQKNDARNTLGVIYIRLKRYADAAAAFQEALDSSSSDSDHTLYRYNLALALERNQRLDESAKQYQQVIREQPDYTKAVVAYRRILEQTGHLTAASAIEICSLHLAGKHPDLADRCYQDELQANATPGSTSPDLLVYAVRRFTGLGPCAENKKDKDAKEMPAEDKPWCQVVDDALPKPVSPGAAILQPLLSAPSPCIDFQSAAIPKLCSPGVAEIREALGGDYPTKFDTDAVRSRFPIWASGPYITDFARLLAAAGDRLHNRSFEAGGKQAKLLAEHAAASYAAAWSLDRARQDAIVHAADLLLTYPDIDGRENIILALAKSVSQFDPTKQSDPNWPASFAMFASVGDAVADIRFCGQPEEDLERPLFYWIRALDSERRIGSGTQVQTRFGNVDPANGNPSSSLALNRHLAGCYRTLGKLALSDKFEKATNPETREELRYDPLSTKLHYHGRAMIYPGAIVKSAIWAGALQIVDSPTGWGQGLSGYGRRLAASSATRLIRQAMALNIDVFLRQDPHFVQAPFRGTGRRLWHAVRQTVVTHTDGMGWQFAYWRVGSAFGSEMVSDLYRPRGNGIADAKTRSAVVRGSMVLGFDTVSNALREFVPRSGKLGRFFSHFM